MFFPRVSAGDRERAAAWAADHPEAPVVASREGAVIAVRRGSNHASREDWERLLKVDGQLRALAVCAEIAGFSPQPPVVNRSHMGRRPQAAGLLKRVRRFAGQVKSYLKAKLGPRLSEEQAAERLAICLSNICGVLRVRGEKRYCGACGCPRVNPDAELHRKVRMLEAKCPRLFWPKVSGSHE